MADLKYAAPPPDCLIAVPLEEVTALFHRPSAMTHVVAEPVPEIIAALQPEPLLLTALLKKLEISDSADARASLAARLEELEASGLVSRT